MGGLTGRVRVQEIGHYLLGSAREPPVRFSVAFPSECLSVQCGNRDDSFEFDAVADHHQTIPVAAGSKVENIPHRDISLYVDPNELE